jgi:rhodanese-related sulfurtransferase
VIALARRNIFVALAGESLPPRAYQVYPENNPQLRVLLLDTPSRPDFGSLSLGGGRLYTISGDSVEGAEVVIGGEELGAVDPGRAIAAVFSGGISEAAYAAADASKRQRQQQRATPHHPRHAQHPRGRHPAAHHQHRRRATGGGQAVVDPGDGYLVDDQVDLDLGDLDDSVLLGDVEGGIEETRAELATKSKHQIEAETAATWSERAIVVLERYAATRKPDLLVQAAGYTHEAIEHAAEAGGDVLAKVRGDLAEAKARLGLDELEDLGEAETLGESLGGALDLSGEDFAVLGAIADGEVDIGAALTDEPFDLRGYRSLKKQHEIPEPDPEQEEIARAEDELGEAPAEDDDDAMARVWEHFGVSPEGDLILDVRSEKEATARPMPGAVNVPVDEISRRIDKIKQIAGGRRVVVFCIGGLRASRACYLLHAAGIDARNGHATLAAEAPPAVPAPEPAAEVSGAEHDPGPSTGRERAIHDKAQELVAGWKAIEQRMTVDRLDGATLEAIRGYYHRWLTWWKAWIARHTGGNVSGAGNDDLEQLAGAVDTFNAAAAILSGATDEQIRRIADIHARLQTHKEAVNKVLESEESKDAPFLQEYAKRLDNFRDEMNALGDRAKGIFSSVSDGEIRIAEGQLKLLVDEWNGSILTMLKKKRVEEMKKILDETEQKRKAGELEQLKPGDKPVDEKELRARFDAALRQGLDKSQATTPPAGPGEPMGKPEECDAVCQVKRTSKHLAIGAGIATAGLVALKLLLKGI